MHWRQIDLRVHTVKATNVSMADVRKRKEKKEGGTSAWFCISILVAMTFSTITQVNAIEHNATPMIM